MSERVGDAERPTPRLDDGSERHAIRLGFARGVAPSKWARRWAEAHRGGDAPALELVPLPVSGRVSEDLDIVLERVAPGSEPEGTAAEGPHGPAPTRHAVRLYTESLALVVAADHELAGAESAGRDALALVTLLGHPDHSPAWPDPEPWQDPSWAPKNAAAALELVATGLGAILLPLPLARHLSAKREHAVLPLLLDPPLPGTTIWASWATGRDAADIQQLVGIMRGRTARSGRPGAGDPTPTASESGEGSAGSRTRPRRAQGASAQPQAKKKALPKNSRGAQLAAARAKKRGRR